MSDHDPRSTNVHVTPVVPPPTGGGSGGLSFAVGAMLVALLAVGYFAIGMPGIPREEARAPDRKVDITIQNQQPPAAPARPTPPPARQ